MANVVAVSLSYIPGAERVVAALGRRFHSVRAVSSLCFHFGNALATRTGHTSRLARVGRNATLRVTLDEHMFRSIYFFGTHERDISDTLAQLVESGDNWLDIGANIGLFTITLAELIGPNGSVIAYEPNPHLANRIRLSVEENHFIHVDVRPVAVGASEGIAELHIPVNPETTPGGSGRSSLLKIRGLAGTKAVSVKVISIDGDISDTYRVDGIKMDVEGYEGSAVMGMRGLLTRHAPRLILFEAMNTESAVMQPSELIRTFEAYGYSCYHVATKSPLSSFQKYVGGISDNVLAIRSDAVEAVLSRWT